eukprot:594853-Pleurochrysis_carterae.AAC.16
MLLQTANSSRRRARGADAAFALACPASARWLCADATDATADSTTDAQPRVRSEPTRAADAALIEAGLRQGARSGVGPVS